MSLYDDDGTKSKSADITMKFLQAQIQQRRSNLASSGTLPAVQAKPVIAPVMDLSGRSRSGSAMKPLRPIKATPLPDSAPLLFIPKAAVEDKVCIFGEVTIENEYQPAVPNDFYTMRKKRDEREARERAARQVAERLEREHREEQKKREKGAAIAPPSALLEPEQSERRSPSPPSSFQSAPSFAIPAPPFKQFGQAAATSRGLGVAANIMSRMGYREGAGLGKDEQGMSTALTMEKTGRNSGNIVAEQPGQSALSSGSTHTFSQTNIAEAMKNATKIILLQNMLTKADVDDELEPEIREEMSKYGQVVNVVVHEVPGAPEDDEIRIFIEFTNVAQAIKAFVVQSGRYFAGRLVRASFFPVDDYNNRQFA